MQAARPIVAVLAVIAALAAAGTAAALGTMPVCGDGVIATASCNAIVVTGASGIPRGTAAPSGYGPADFRAAYSLPAAPPSPQTIAIVDAYDDPTAASDLQVYSQQYGVPCNGCLTKVNQNGATSPLPAADAGWALEISLDLDAAHGLCPTCSILLVEASSNSFADLAAAEDTAARLGANVISNSYGGNEFSAETSATYASHFNHPGVAITVSSGDSGYGVEFPAASPYVTAVGGTTLSLNADGSRLSETAWNGSGSGCSAYVAKPSWQHDSGCARRAVADVSADADPATGAAVYDSTPYNGQSGWFSVGGTSLAAPLVAAVYALAGNASSTTYGSVPYAHTSSLYDVTSGSNGICLQTYLCTAGPGYDGPTGLGSPLGTGAF